MLSLYDAGWRLGTIFNATLPLDAVVVGDDGKTPVLRQQQHGRWVIAAQECDLAQHDRVDPNPVIELRPVHTSNPPEDWGIRSAKFRLTEADYVAALDPRLHVSPAVLTALRANGDPQDPSDARSRAFAIWLGKRYDRPAVPNHLVLLARRIADVVTAKAQRPTGAAVRDVLMQFDDTQNPVRYTLVAVLQDAGDAEHIREWLAGLTSKIPVELGIADQIFAAAADEISLDLIENSFAANTAHVTWRPNSPEPTGAE